MASIVKTLRGSTYTQKEKQKMMDQKDCAGCAPWVYSLFCQEATLIKCFVDIGCDFFPVDTYGRTVFHETAWCPAVTIINTIASADLRRTPLRRRDVYGKSGVDIIKYRILEAEELHPVYLDRLNFPREKEGALAEAEALLSLLHRAATFDPSIWDDLDVELGGVEEAAQKLLRNWPVPKDDGSRPTATSEESAPNWCDPVQSGGTTLEDFQDAVETHDGP